jgi:hypothetical protein
MVVKTRREKIIFHGNPPHFIGIVDMPSCGMVDDGWLEVA